MAADADDGVSAITTIIAALKPLDESTRQNVLDFVLKQLGIKLSVGVPPLKHSVFDSGFPLTLEDEEEEEEQDDGGSKDIRSLAEQKKPKTVNDKVAVLAYYLKTATSHLRLLSRTSEGIVIKSSMSRKTSWPRLIKHSKEY
jgi:hypothetical protein